MELCIRRYSELQQSLQSLTPRAGWAELFKTGKRLTMDRVLGLAVEQAFLVLFATGTLDDAVACILVAGVSMAQRARADDCFVVSIPLGRSQQTFVEQVVHAIFTTLSRRKFQCTGGVDAPYANFGGSGMARRHDLVGVFCAHDDAEVVGLTTIEIFTSHGSVKSKPARDKRAAVLKNFAHAGPDIHHRLFCLVRYRGHSSQPEYVETVWQKLDGGAWIHIFKSQVEERGPSQLDAAYERLVGALTLVKIKKRKAYVMERVLYALKYNSWSGQVARRLLALGVTGIFQHAIKGKAGGLKKKKQKKRLAWYITPAGLKAALPHLKVRAIAGAHEY